jgi:hypothetical protein
VRELDLLGVAHVGAHQVDRLPIEVGAEHQLVQRVARHLLGEHGLQRDFELAGAGEHLLGGEAGHGGDAEVVDPTRAVFVARPLVAHQDTEVVDDRELFAQREVGGLVDPEDKVALEHRDGDANAPLGAGGFEQLRRGHERLQSAGRVALRRRPA